MCCDRGLQTHRFQSTLSLRRATSVSPVSDPAALISIHALLAESDELVFLHSSAAENFNPRSPCGERLRRSLLTRSCTVFQSTLSLRRATWDRITAIYHHQRISIHALLAESDLITSHIIFLDFGFQSTLSLRRATPSPGSSPGPPPNFNPRSPCGERRRDPSRGCRDRISIHALLAESDGFTMSEYIDENLISIHALLAESDGTPLLTLRWPARFQSTLSLRRATRHSFAFY